MTVSVVGWHAAIVDGIVTDSGKQKKVYPILEIYTSVSAGTSYESVLYPRFVTLYPISMALELQSVMNELVEAR